MANAALSASTDGQVRHTLDSSDKAYAFDKHFWDQYLKGRPRPPDAFFERIYKYHKEHGGQFGVVHDAGAGVGPYSGKLRERFEHVLVSDIVPYNVEQAERRLGTEGYSYRVAKIEDAAKLEPASIDLFFASTRMHFCDVELAQEAIAKQLKPGGTFVCTGFGIARYVDSDVQDIFTRLREQGARILYRHSTSPEAAAKRLRSLARSSAGYDFALTSEKHFRPGALRITLASPVTGGDQYFGMIPEELESLVPREPPAAGPNDVYLIEQMEGWKIETDLAGIKDQFATFAFAAHEPEAYEPLWMEMEEVMKDGRVAKGWFPAKLIMATRR